MFEQRARPIRPLRRQVPRDFPTSGLTPESHAELLRQYRLEAAYQETLPKGTRLRPTRCAECWRPILRGERSCRSCAALAAAVRARPILVKKVLDSCKD